MDKLEPIYEWLNVKFYKKCPEIVPWGEIKNIKIGDKIEGWEIIGRAKNINHNVKIILFYPNLKLYLIIRNEDLKRKIKNINDNFISFFDKQIGQIIVLKPTNKKAGHKIWECKCLICNEIFKVTTRDLKQGSHCFGCQKCANKKIGENSKKDLTGQKFGKLTIIKDSDQRYRGKVVWECKCDCGNFTLVNGNDLISGHTMSCGCMSQSKGEFFIEKILKEKSINFISEYSFKNCKNLKTNAYLRFDFYLPDYNICIEYDGMQHFKESSLCSDTLQERQERDNIKTQYCKNNNIKLLRISYTEDTEEKIRKIIEDFLEI